MSNAIFSVVDVTCSRNNQVLFSGVNFSISEGQILHVRGENGVGKTTLLRCLAGLSTPCQGSIKWLNDCIADNEIYKKQLHFLGHKQFIKSALSVKENLTYSFLQQPVAVTQQEIVLSRVGLLAEQHVLARSLSSGQRQRLAIARVMLSGAKLWLLDEPLTSLDHAGIDLVQSLMEEHLSRKGLIIFTSHHELTRQILGYQTLHLRPASLQMRLV